MNIQRQSGFHLIPIVIILAVVGLIGLVAWRVIGSMQDEAGGFQAQHSGGCTDGDVAFTSPPMKIEDIGYIRPLGAMLDGHVTPTDHVYVAPANPNVPDNTYPVLMPADGTITEVGRMPAEYIGDRAGMTMPQDDHRITIQFSCRYYAIYIHIHKLADIIGAQTADLKPGSNKTVSINLKAGDTVGFIGGSTFDWTPVDTQKTLTGFISPDLYKGESWKIHTVSPFDLYTGDLKTQLEAKSLRSIPPLGGKIDYDQPGKLIGNWFREGTNGYSGASGNNGGERYWDGHLSVVPDYIDPTYTIVSLGNWQGAAKQFVVKQPANPAEISASNNVVKYELYTFSYVTGNNQHSGSPNNFTKGMHPSTNGELAGTVAFQVLSGEKLKVEKFPGVAAASVQGFTSAAETYER